MQNPIRSYRDLIVWQRSMELVGLAYAIARLFPKFETYGLCQQLRRAAVSVAANIAEGHGRAHRGEYRYHLSVAYASLMEAETEVSVGVQENYCTSEQAEEFFRCAASVGMLLNGLMRALRPDGARSRTPDPRSQTPDPRSLTPGPGPRTP